MTIGRSGLVLLVTGSPGTASVIAQAIDDSTLQEQEGTLAGDNTLLVLFADESRLERWLERFDEHPIRAGRLRPATRGGQFMKKVVLAYSGGLDTSVAVAWLREQYDCEVVTLTIDVGGGSLREGVEKRAMSAGASRAYVVDARERFVTDFVWPHLQANALYQGAYPAGHRPRPAADRPAPRRGRAAARAPTRSPTAAPARATTRSASTSPSMRSTRASRSSRRCGSGWA